MSPLPPFAAMSSGPSMAPTGTTSPPKEGLSSTLGRRPVKLFCCYDPQDKKHYEQLRKQLAIPIRQNDLHARCIDDVPAGDHKRATWMIEVQSADIVVFLLSAAMTADEDLYQLVESARRRSEARQCVVVPVRLRKVTLTQSHFDGLQILPRDGRSVCGRKDKDGAWAEIAAEISDRVNEAVQRFSAAPLHPSPQTDAVPAPTNKPSVSPAPRPSPAQREMRSRVDHLLRATPAVQQELATWLLTKRNNDEETDAPEPDVDEIVASLFEEGWSAEDLAEGLRFCIEARGMTDSDRVVVQEVARLVLPQSKEVREKLGEWRKELAGKILVLPYGTQAKAEGALSRLGDRPYREHLHGSGLLMSEAMFPVSQIRSGSALAVLSSRPLIEEIARYFASNVYLGPRRLEEKKLLAEDPRYSNLDFTKEGDLDILLGALNDKLRFHASARDDDLLPMHIEIDDDTLSARLTDANDALLRDLREAFPRLSFVRLNKKAGHDGYFVDCLLKIFLPVRKASA